MGYEARERITALRQLGRRERSAGELEAARTLYEEAVLLCRQERHPVLLAHTLRHLGDVHREAGRSPKAETCYEEAIRIYRDQDGTRLLDLANALRSVALLREADGNGGPACECWEEARSIYAKLGADEAAEECSAHLEASSRR